MLYRLSKRAGIIPILFLALAALCLPSQALPSDPIQPDPAKTPGVVLTTDTGKVCIPNYSATVRNTSPALKRAVYASYGIKPNGTMYEIDHRLPLSLGGADMQNNLWPETRDRRIRENAWEKDKLESLVHRLVCIKRTMTLAEGQAIFLSDWLVAYRKFIGPL